MARVSSGQANIMELGSTPCSQCSEPSPASPFLGPQSKLGQEAEGGSELPALPVHHTSEEGATREPSSACCLEKAGGTSDILCSWANFFSLTKG